MGKKNLKDLEKIKKVPVQPFGKGVQDDTDSHQMLRITQLLLIGDY